MALRVRKPEAIPSLVGQSLEARDATGPRIGVRGDELYQCAFMQVNMAGTEARRHRILVAAGVPAGHY